MNRQMLAEVMAILIFLAHVVSVGMVWLLSSSGRLAAQGLAIEQILFPVTAAYTLGCARFIIDQPARNSRVKVRKSYVIFLGISSLGIIGIPVGIIMTHQGILLTSVDQINNYFAAIEVAFGGVFALFYADLFKADS